MTNEQFEALIEALRRRLNMQPNPKAMALSHSVRGARSTLPMLTAALTLSACSTLEPQIFHAEMLTEKGQATGAIWRKPDGKRVSLQDAMQRADMLQRQYVTAVKQLSEMGTGSSAALIGLSALGLLKSLTHPNGSDLAGLGIAGSATYGYSVSMVSKPRQLLYLAGAESLSCAMTASDPFDVEPSSLREPDPTPPKGEADVGKQMSLQALATAAKNQLLLLDQHIDKLRSLNKTIVQNVPEGKPAPPYCSRMSAPQCETPTATTTPDRQMIIDVCKATKERYSSDCAGQHEVQRDELPHASVGETLAYLQKLHRYIASKVGAVPRTIVQFENAGPALWDRTKAIQFKVAAEVLRTEPDVSGVLALTKGIKDNAFALSGSQLLAPAPPASAASSPAAKAPVPDAKTGIAQASGGPIKRNASKQVLPVYRDAPDAELDAAHQVALKAQAAVRPLADRLDDLNQRVRQARAALDRCSVTVPGNTLTVIPDQPEVTVVGGAKLDFIVSGGSGLPRASVVVKAGAANAGKVELTLDPQGHFKFTYTAPAEVVEATGAVLHFTDGAGAISRSVDIHFHKPAAADNADKTAPPAPVAVNDKNLKQLARLLNIDPKESNLDKLVAAKIERCQKTVLKRTETNGQMLDDETIKALFGESCANV